LFLVLAGVVGVLAALWPGFRAARTPPLSAIATA
jgi:putative ABC transport system permease protein